MAEAALFIGWGNVVRGREQRALDVFNESVETWGGFQRDGRIEDFEVALLNPHGGDLNGFALLRASREQLAELQASEDFRRMVTRANLIVEGLGVVQAVINEGLADQMRFTQAEIAEVS